MKQFIIIGNSAAGIAAVEAIRKVDRESKIMVISDEPVSSYCRCLISYYLSGEVKEDKIWFKTQNFYQGNNVELLLDKKVARVDVKKNRIICEDKAQFSYDALLIATGASPKFPETAGIKKRGVFGFRTLKDAQEISGLLPVTKSACILGGGLIGLKAAYALKKKQVDVKIVIKSKQALSQMLDFEAAGFVQKRLEDNGIEVILGQDVAEIIGNGDIKAVKLDSGKVFDCSLVVVGKGVSANIALVKDTEIKTNEGIIANESLGTSVPNIYTAGDVCESFDLTLNRYSVNALWPVAVEQGKVAGSNMAGQKLKYAGSLGMNALEFFGLPVVSLGIFRTSPENPGLEEFKIKDAKAGIYKKVILENGILVGAVLAGRIENSGVFLRMIQEKINVSSFKERLLSDNFGYPDILALVKERESIYV